MNYTKYIKCSTKRCKEILEISWDYNEGFKKVKCPSCKELFQPYLETKLKLMRK